jgi:alkanesulfonate monooxygenase SsuD/methylene tetrahydromethanopterin reductase-like flavin-dependent oxidoreductase (luciferase family)
VPAVQHALYVPPFATFGDVNVLVELAQSAEQAGWDGFYLWDHLLYQDDVPFVDAWIALAAIAAATDRIRLGPLITPLPRRRPWKVAREAVTLDHLSAGRVVLGVGLGIDFWHEFSAFGGEAADDSERALLLDDGIEIIKRLWTGEPVTYEGARLSVDGARFAPTPLQTPRIPIWSAVLWPPRPNPVRRAAGCDGVAPFRPDGPLTPDNVRELRAAIERERANTRMGGEPFDICLHGPHELRAGYEEAGVTWFMESFFPEEPLADVRRIIERGPAPA